MVTTSGIWLINSENKILLVHPTYHPKNFFSIPKGLVDEGEDEFTAAKRELFEETAIKWEDIMNYIVHLEDLGYKDYKNGKKRLKSFIVKCNSDLSFLEMRCDSMVESHKWSPFPEVDQFEWKSIEEIISEETSLHHAHEMCIEEVNKVIKLFI